MKRSFEVSESRKQLCRRVISNMLNIPYFVCRFFQRSTCELAEFQRPERRRVGLTAATTVRTEELFTEAAIMDSKMMQHQLGGTLAGSKRPLTPALSFVHTT